MKNTILLILLILLGYLYYYDIELEKKNRESPYIFTNRKIGKVSALNIEFFGENFRAEKKDGWWIVDPENVPADNEVVEEFINELLKMKMVRVAGKIRNKKGLMDEEWETYMQQYGLDLPDIAIDIMTNSGVETLRLGKPTPSVEFMYAKKDNDERIFMIYRDIREKLLKKHNVTYWRDKKLLHLKKEEISAFVISRQDSRIRLERSGGAPDEWMITEPVSSPADKYLANGLLDLLINLKGSAVYDTLPQSLPSNELPVAVIQIEADSAAPRIDMFLPRNSPGFAKLNDKYYTVNNEIIFGFNFKMSDLQIK